MKPTLRHSPRVGPASPTNTRSFPYKFGLADEHELMMRMNHGMPPAASNQPTVDRKRNDGGGGGERERETCPK